MAQIQSLPVTVSDMHRTSRCDHNLSKIYQYLCNAWPKEVEKELMLYKSKQEGTGMEGGAQSQIQVGVMGANAPVKDFPPKGVQNFKKGLALAAYSLCLRQSRSVPHRSLL